MNRKIIFSRIDELKILSGLQKSQRSEFCAFYGRRRVGKTYLIRESLKASEFYFEFSGIKNATKKLQIKNFLRSLNTDLNVSRLPADDVEDWTDALNILATAISKDRSKNKKIIFFDELPWLASKKSGFLQALDSFWNSFVSKRKDVLLIVCGSAASWMISELINNKNGLHNRLTIPPVLIKPFTLNQTRQYLISRKIDLNFEQIIELYMATGGVAYYLDLYHAGQSAAQYININYFSSSGGLRDEYDRLFQSLFDNYQTHTQIVDLLAAHSHGLSQQQILEKLKIKSGGSFTKILTELEKSNFIQFIPQLENQKKEGTYRLIDEYVLFYSTWIKKLGRSMSDHDYWQKQIGKPKHNSWMGTCFENMCLKHAYSLKKSLGISGLTTSEHIFRNKTAQIDLVIDRSDKVINLFEMKYTNKPFEMTEVESKKIKNRKQELLANLKRKRQVFITLVTTFEAHKNKHYIGTVDQELHLEDLFN